MRKIPTPTLRASALADVTVGLDPQGVVWVSDDGRSWYKRADLPGQPQAVTVDGYKFYAATTTGLYVSDNDGTSWESIL